MPNWNPARRTVVVAASLLASLATGVVAPTAQAQSRHFEACVYGPFQTCSAFTLKTTFIDPFTNLLFPLGGTAVDLFVRQTTLSDRATGLRAISFFGPLALGADASPLPVSSLTAEGSVPPVSSPSSWVSQGTGSRIDLYDDGSAEPGMPAGSTQYVAGCAGGLFSGGLLSTPLVTCLPGGYRFQFGTSAYFSASDLAGFGFELYAGTDAEAENGRTVSCTFVDEPFAGTCIDPSNLTDPLVPFGRPEPTTTVPEPATIALLGAGLLVLLAGAARRRA